MEHECPREHNNRHVNPDWIVRHYLEKIREDPSWKLVGIIETVKTNQEVGITGIKAYRAKSIAQK